MRCSRMLGDSARHGRGGRDCPCCGLRPGAERKRERRTQRRREDMDWRRDVAVIDDHDEPFFSGYYNGVLYEYGRAVRVYGTHQPQGQIGG